jgi:phage tail-like protein
VNPPSLVRAFNFYVSLFPSGTSAPTGSDATSVGQSPAAGFQECSGLSVDMEVQEYPEGGNNNAIIRRVGRAKYTLLILKRGMFYASGGQANPKFWQWFQDIVDGRRPVQRYDGIVQVKALESDDFVAKWEFTRGLPARVVGPTLNAQTGEIALEELHIAHEGLRLDVGG